jgi:hypothetical protein
MKSINNSFGNLLALGLVTSVFAIGLQMIAGAVMKYVFQIAGMAPIVSDLIIGLFAVGVFWYAIKFHKGQENLIDDLPLIFITGLCAGLVSTYYPMFVLNYPTTWVGGIMFLSIIYIAAQLGKESAGKFLGIDIKG